MVCRRIFHYFCCVFRHFVTPSQTRFFLICGKGLANFDFGSTNLKGLVIRLFAGEVGRLLGLFKFNGKDNVTQKFLNFKSNQNFMKISKWFESEQLWD